MPRSRQLVFGGTLLLITANATAAPIPPFAQPTNAAGQRLLSFELENRFRNFMQRCGNIQVPLRMRREGGLSSGTRDVSSIDVDIIDGLNLRNSSPAVSSTHNVSLGRLFGYVYPAVERERPNWTPGQFLRLGYEDQDKILAPGFPSTRYEASCGSVVEGALRVNAEYSFPVATLRGALSADYSSNTNTSIQLAHGRFDSPIWEMWSPTNANSGRTGDRFYAGILFWDWYRNRPAGTYYLMRSFNGTALYRQIDRRSTGSAGASGEARLSIPVVTAETRFDVRGTRESLLEIEDFELFLAAAGPGGPPTIAWETLPPLSDIVGAVETSAVRGELIYEGGQLVQSGQTKAFSIDVRSMPRAYCATDLWQIRNSLSDTAVSELLSVLDAREVPTGDTTACRFRLSYAPGTASAVADVNLTPVLFSSEERAGHRLRLPLGRVTFSRSPRPTLSVVRVAEPMIQLIPGSTNRYNLTWRIDMRLDDDGRFADINRIHVEELTFTCPANTLTAGAVQFSDQFIGTPGPTSRTVQITGIAEYQGDLNPLAAEHVDCTLAGDILFTPSDGSQAIRRQVPSVPVKYPKPRREQ
jgi:hypothetical protein